MKALPFNYDEVTVVAGMVYDSMYRDQLDFQNYSNDYKDPFLPNFRIKIDAVESRVRTRIFRAQLKSITQRIYSDLDILKRKLTLLEGYIKKAESNLNVCIKDFGIVEIRDKMWAREIEGLIDKMITMLQLVDANIDALKDKGFKDDDKTALDNLLESIRSGNLNQNMKMDEKEAAVQANLGSLLELWTITAEIMDVGKRIYKYDNKEKTGDYTATKIKSRIRQTKNNENENNEPEPDMGLLTGIVQNKNNDEPIEGATVLIVETNDTTETDEDGEYDFDKINVGTYTLKGIMDGFKDVIIENVVIEKDNTTQQNIKLEENEPPVQ